MEPINPAQAQRVWQRVRGTEPEGGTLAKLLTLEAEARCIYQYLHRNTPLRDSRLLHRLREESRQFSSVLSGLCLILEEDVTLSASPSIRGNPEGLLLRCWKLRQQLLLLLDALPPACSPWAKRLQDRMEEHAMALLELLGQLPRK